MGFSGTEVSEKGFPKGWNPDADDLASQRVFRVTQLLEAMVFRPWSWDIFNSLNLKYAFHGGLIDTGANWLLIPDGTVTLVDDATNFVERSDGGVVAVNQAGFTYVGFIPMAQIEAANGGLVPTSYIDRRPDIGGAPSGGGSSTSFAQLTGQIFDAQVPLSAVKQWEAFLDISFAQMTDQIFDAQVPESAVTQHEAALSLLFTQLTDSIADAQVPESAVTQHEAALSLLFTQLTDQIADAQVPKSAVWQHILPELPAPFETLAGALDFLVARATLKRPKTPSDRIYANATFA